jgi:antitoxin MazE
VLTIRSQLVKIGNSQGVRIPKVMLDQLDFADGVELIISDKQLIVRSKRMPRQGWAEQFKQMHQLGEDQLLDPEIIETTWEKEEWQW